MIFKKEVISEYKFIQELLVRKGKKVLRVYRQLEISEIDANGKKIYFVFQKANVRSNNKMERSTITGSGKEKYSFDEL